MNDFVDDFDDDLTVAFKPIKKPEPEAAGDSAVRPEPQDAFDDDLTVGTWYRPEQSDDESLGSPPLSGQSLPAEVAHTQPPPAEPTQQAPPPQFTRPEPERATQPAPLTAPNSPPPAVAPSQRGTAWVPPTRQLPGPTGVQPSASRLSLPIIVVGVAAVVIIVGFIVWLVLKGDSTALDQIGSTSSWA